VNTKAPALKARFIPALFRKKIASCWANTAFEFDEQDYVWD
jgi:hypothetical protein